MSAKPLEEFKEQLNEASARVHEIADKYPDLPPESRQESKDYLDKFIETAQRMRKEMQEAEKADPDSRIVQVIGLQNRNATVEDFEKSFKYLELQGQRFRRQNESVVSWIPEVKSLKKEINYRLDANHILQPAASEWFLEFHKATDAKLALTMPPFKLQVKEPNNCVAGFQVTFAKPSQDLALRATFRKIGNLMERLKAIDKEYKEIGAIRQYGTPVLAPGYIDKRYLLFELPKWKKLRDNGQSLDHNALGPLQSIPVDVQAFATRIKQLFDEETDIKIEIAEYRLNGLKFFFEV
jgi:hypothetical protein